MDADGPSERTIVDKITLETSISDLRSDRARRMMQDCINNMEEELQKRFSVSELEKILDWQKGGEEPSTSTVTSYYACENSAISDAAKKY